MDSRYIFLQPLEYNKIVQSFFGDRVESLQVILEQIEEHKVLAGGQDYINVTVFLLIMLMEFRKKRSVMNGEVYEMDKDEHSLLDALIPRLESSLNKILSMLSRENEDLKETGKKELMRVFTDYLKKLIRELVNGDLEGAIKILELGKDKTELEFVKDVATAVQECFQKNEVQENIEVLAEGIFSVSLYKQHYRSHKS